MEGSKLIQLLQTFDTQELRAFKDFVASPFYNKNRELMDFYDYLKKIAPAFPEKKIQKEQVYKTLFPGKKYDDKHFKYLMSFLLKLGEEYIGLRKYQKEETLKSYHVLEACLDRNLDKSYQNIYRKAREKVNNNPLRDTVYYYQEYLLADLADRHFSKLNVRKLNEKLQLAADYFDLYFLSKKLKYSCEMLDFQNFFSIDYQQHLVEEISNYLKHKKHDDVPVIAIFYQVFLALTEENKKEHFDKLKALMEQYESYFTAFEMKRIYIHALNYCIRKIRQREDQYVEEALDLYMIGIQKKYLFDGAYLTPFSYKNIVKLGLRLQRYEWTEEAIKKYNHVLEENFRTNALNYCLADLYYHKGEFEAAMEHLRNVEFTDIFFTLDAKIMLLKIYYDKDAEEALHSLLASFKIFIKRNKLISNKVQATYQNFILLLGQLMKRNQQKLPAIKQKILDSELLTDRNWLLQVVERLEGNRKVI